MLIILHHADQHFLGDPVFAVGFSMSIQVIEPGALEGTDLTVERF